MTYGAPLEWENVAVALERLAAQSAADDEAAAILLDYARSWRNVLYNNHDPRRLRWLHAAVATAQRAARHGTRPTFSRPRATSSPFGPTPRRPRQI
ncbi:MAG: hypothetical protein HZY76_09650 [Anaerolineae bacterium]|nr:MAG: hypothetical protein HZY76_09650 [Anaerolineae bacterium]